MKMHAYTELLGQYYGNKVEIAMSRVLSLLFF